MRLFATLLVLAPLVAAPALARADEPDAVARDIIANAAKAHGGADALAKTQKLSREGKGTLTLAKDLPFTDQSTLDLPQRARIAIEIDKKQNVLLVFDKDRGWQATGGPAAELPKERVPEVATELYVTWVATLVPLREKEFQLTALPDAEVDKKPALGVRVARKDRPDVLLYFDKETKLLVKVARRVMEGGLPLDKATLFADYQTVDGVKLPGKVTEFVNDRKFSECAFTYKLLARVEDSTFAKP